MGFAGGYRGTEVVPAPGNTASDTLGGRRAVEEVGGGEPEGGEVFNTVLGDFSVLR